MGKDKMTFREWLILVEMAHFVASEPLFDYNGQLVYMADMRFEDNPETRHLNQGSSFIANLRQAMKEDPNISMIGGPWLIYNGKTFKAKVGIPDEKERSFEEIPSGWVKYAELYNKNYEPVKDAAFDALKRLAL